MNAKTMEGLVGARTNMNLLNTPLRVYKEARRKGDTATMERAMGYVGEFSDKAEEYKTEADEGMEEDARMAREKAKLQREEAIRKRREEREESEKKLAEKMEDQNEENKNMDSDMDTEATKEDSQATGDAKEPVAYTSTGAAVVAEQSVGVNVSVSV